MGEERLGELQAELERLSEHLADAAMDLLRAGLAEGTDVAAGAATRQERLVNRARASVERAARLLGEAVAAGDPSRAATAEDPHGGDEEGGQRRSRRPGRDPHPWDSP